MSEVKVAKLYLKINFFYFSFSSFFIKYRLSKKTKLLSYWNTSFSKICLGIKIGQQVNFVAITKKANSLFYLIADGQYRALHWVVTSGSLRLLYCSKEGLNVGCTNQNSARIGILGNNGNKCSSCDSRLGFGARGFSGDTNTCGNLHIKDIGYILVQ